MCFSLELFEEEVMVRSARKSLDLLKIMLANSYGYETESDEFDDLMRYG
jgi:hypothetical protein